MNHATPTFGPGSVLGGKYRLDAMLGQGGMGTVWAAENVDIGRKVAIKLLHPQFAADPDVLARFRLEARAAASIGHPGIVDVLDMGQTPEGEAYLVMQYLEGETVGARLQRSGAMDLSSAAWICAEVLEAIAAAHEREIIHRDLKPDNVFLAERPAVAVKILDFGISKFHAADEKANLTRTGMVLGTPAYMAPEQARGAKGVGPAADLYAIGAILYEMLAGVPAFAGDTYNQILARIITDDKKPLGELRPDVPEPIRRFVETLMARRPEDRPANARAAKASLLEQVEACRAAGPLGATCVAPIPLLAAPIPLLAAVSVPGALRRLLLGALPLALLAALLGLGAAALRLATASFFPGVQGLVAGALAGGLAATLARRERFALGSAAANGLLVAAVFLAAELLFGDLLRPLIVVGGWLLSMLRGELHEWLYSALLARGPILGLAAGDALFALTAADAVLAGLVSVTVQRIAGRTAAPCPRCGAPRAKEEERCTGCSLPPTAAAQRRSRALAALLTVGLGLSLAAAYAIAAAMSLPPL